MPGLRSERKELLTVVMREAIYEAAVSVLAEHGVTGMAMDRVAAAADLAKGSLYQYLTDEEDLLQFTYTKAFEPLLTAAEEVYRTSLPAPEKREAILRPVFGNLAKHRELFSLLLKDDAALHLPTRDERFSRRIAIFAGIFQQGIRPFAP